MYLQGSLPRHDSVHSSLLLQRNGGTESFTALGIVFYCFKFAPRAGAMFSQICLPVVFLSIIILSLNYGRDLRVNRRASIGFFALSAVYGTAFQD